MKKIKRRDLLQRAAWSSGGLLVWASWPAVRVLGASDAAPHLKFPTAPRERLAVATWPFRAEMESPSNTYRDKKQKGMDLKDFAIRVKIDFQVPGVEPLSAHFPSTGQAYLDRFREAVEKAGVHVVNIPVDNKYSFYDADAATRQKALAHARKWIDVAVVLGSPSVRTSIAQTKNGKPDVTLASECLERLADYGGSKNIVVNLENDDPESEDASFVVKVIERVNHPYLHALPDFCNSMLGGDEQANYQAMKALFPLAYNICHVKDSEAGDDGKMVHVDVKKTFEILNASGYRGYCSIEWEGAGDAYAGTRALIQASLGNLG